VMFFHSERLKVALATVHIALADVAQALTPDVLASTIRTTADALPGFGIPRPRLAVAGLNPHCGEHGLMGHEDDRVVAPVVAFAERPPTLTPDGYEVASVFGAPLAAFVRGAPIEIVTAERDGYRLRYGAYRVGEHLVWGATAMMLGRLGAFLGQKSERR